MGHLAVFFLLLGVSSLVMAGCEPEEVITPEEETILPAEEAVMPETEEAVLSLSSSAFEEGEKIPVRYTCDGEDVSPPLTWSEPPSGTNSFVLIVDDPDAPRGVFTHWVLFNLPPDSRELPEDIPVQAQLLSGALQGRNDFGRTGYGGPCPPAGSLHRYRFVLYALDQPLDLPAGASKNQVLEYMEGHILAQGQLMGTYQR